MSTARGPARARGAGRERWQFKFGSRERAPSERADALAKLNCLVGFKFGSWESAPSERADALAKLNRLAG
jgi:hypothetical protein